MVSEYGGAAGGGKTAMMAAAYGIDLKNPLGPNECERCGYIELPFGSSVRRIHGPETFEDVCVKCLEKEENPDG